MTVSLVPLLAGSNWGTAVAVQGFEAGPDTDDNSRFNEVGPGYFRTLGMPLMAGREFTDADGLEAQKVAIVNEAFVKKFNLGPTRSASMMGTDGRDGKLDMRDRRRRARTRSTARSSDVMPPLFFQPYRQDEHLGSGAFYVRTAGDPAQLCATITASSSRSIRTCRWRI